MSESVSREAGLHTGHLYCSLSFTRRQVREREAGEEERKRGEE